MPGRRSPGEDVVDELLPPGRLLDLHQASATAIGDARLGNFLVRDRVVGGDIHRTHDAGDVQHAHFEVDAHFLRTADHEVAVRKDVGDHGGDEQVDLLGALDPAFALGLGVGV